MKEAGLNLFSKTLFLTILIKIGLMFFYLTNKMRIFPLKFKSKPSITPAIQKSISDKNNLLKRFINSKDPQRKFFMSNIKITEKFYLPF